MKMRLLAVLALIIPVVAGCASAAKPGAMMTPVEASTLIDARSALYQSTSVASVTGGKDTNPMWMSRVSNEDFAEALSQSLNAHTILAVNGARLELAAQLIELKQPFVGLDMTVTARVKYTLRRLADGAVLFDKEISTPYTAKVSESFVGVERLRLANEGAVRANIRQLIEELVEVSSTRTDM